SLCDAKYSRPMRFGSSRYHSMYWYTIPRNIHTRYTKEAYPMPTAAIYARVSSQKQTDNFSTGTQLDMMRDYLVSQGYDVIPLAETGSAFTQGLSRSKLQEALELAKNRKIQVLMFFSPDRFTRDVADGVVLRRDLRESGVVLMCFHPYPREITNDLEI